MRVTLVRSPYYSLFGITTPSYPIGLGYLSSYIKKHGGHESHLVDGETGKFELYKGFWNTGIVSNVKMYMSTTRFFRKNFDVMAGVMNDPEHFVWHYLVNKIVESRPDVVGFSSYTTDVVGVMHITNLLKKKLPDVPIVIGGPHPSALPEETLKLLPSIDYAVFGEGEETFAELVNYLETGESSIEGIKGTVYRKNGRVIKGEMRPFQKNIDVFPPPDRHLGNRANYRFDDYLSTSRGCPFKCTFCTVRGTWSNKVRYRDTAKVIEEIKYLKKNFNTQRITFIDDTFTLNRKRVMGLCQGIIDDGLNDIHYNGTSRADILDEKLIKKLYEAGVKTLRFGIESGSPRILNLIKKGLNAKRVIETFDLCNKNGIDSMANFMVNHPTETEADIKMSMELFKRLRPKRGFVVMTMPFPGTPIYDYAHEIGKPIQLHDYFKFSINGACVANISKIDDKELEKLLWSFHALIERYCFVNRIKLIFKTIIKPKSFLKLLVRDFGVKQPDTQSNLQTK